MGPGSDPAVMWQELIEQVGELYESIAADDRDRVARQIGRIDLVTTVIAGQERVSKEHARSVAWREIMWQRDNGRGPACRGDAGVFPREGE